MLGLEFDVKTVTESCQTKANVAWQAMFFSVYCLHLISTEGALRRPMTYDDHPIPIPIHL